MKTAIYIDQGTTQLVLTPENEWEKKICDSITQGEQQAKIMRGEFFDCRGGWIRHSNTPSSLILRLDVATNTVAE